MGNESSSVRILLDQTRPAFYFAGDEITGELHLNIAETVKQSESISICLTGDIGYLSTSYFRMNYGIQHRVTTRHDMKILNRKAVLNRLIENQQGKFLLDDESTSLNVENLEPGNYKFRFSVRLPDNLPPSIHTEDYPFVRYAIQICVEKNWYCPNTEHSHSIQVQPRVHFSQIPNARSAIKFATKKRNIEVKGTLSRSALTPNQPADVLLEITNRDCQLIKSVDLCLIQRYRIADNRRQIEILRIAIPALCNTRMEYMNASTLIQVPRNTPPSSNYSSKKNGTQMNIDISYDVKVDLKLKGFLGNFDTSIPVGIFNEISQDFETEQPFSCIAEETPIPPPSYESIFPSAAIPQ